MKNLLEDKEGGGNHNLCLHLVAAAHTTATAQGWSIRTVGTEDTTELMNSQEMTGQLFTNYCLKEYNSVTML